MARSIEQVLSDMLEYKKKEGKKPGSILLLGRYGFDGDHLERTGLFEYINRTNKVKSVKYPALDITFMTAHSSKGLGYDDVIVINGKNETYGFPTKVEDDPVLSFVIKGDRSIDYAEERRLFYVAMTRTKNRVFFVAPEANPSEFLLELKQSYKNVKLLGEWNEEEPIRIAKKPCPICGYPMQFKYKQSYGLPLYICTNEPELCGFMTNNYKAGKLSIQKCDKCRDGYLVVKQGKDMGFFLGCTNYKANGTGCGKMLSRMTYYAQMGYKLEEKDSQENDNSEGSTLINSRSVYVTNDSKTHSKKTDLLETTESKETDDYVEIIKASVKPVMFKNYDLNGVVFGILNALQNISRVKFYGITILCDVLKGTDSKRITDAKLNRLPEYGLYKEFPREYLKTIVEWMISEHFILQTKGNYPVLHSTFEGLHYSEYITEGKLLKLKKLLESEVITWNA